MFLNQGMAFSQGAKIAKMKAKKATGRPTLRANRSGASARNLDSCSVKSGSSVCSTVEPLDQGTVTKKVEASDYTNRRGSMETLTTYNSEASSAIVNPRTGTNVTDDGVSVADSMASAPHSVASVTIASNTSVVCDEDRMDKKTARKYVGKVMVKVVEVEQQIDMQLTASQYSTEDNKAEKLQSRHQIVVDAIVSLEDLMQEIELQEDEDGGNGDNAQCEGVKSKVKEIRSKFAEG